jgi:hypothetical protein
MKIWKGKRYMKIWKGKRYIYEVINDRAIVLVKAFPSFVNWGIWLQRNKIIFEDKECWKIGAPTGTFFCRTREIHKTCMSKVFANTFHRPNSSSVFFYGASQGALGMCGEGALLLLNCSHVFSLKFGVGPEQTIEWNFFYLDFIENNNGQEDQVDSNTW